VPLRVGQRLVGSLRVAASPDGLDEQASRLLAGVAEQLAAAIERVRLRQAANEAELLRRADEVRAALRRAGGSSRSGQTLLELGELRIDLDRREVSMGGRGCT
jgi:GAF domain-containing protein